ncbi:sensor histidine kinase [Krasilnikoviella flava]|uniref:histidine kinase n=1 Tax=Krasilnikoviella flava TaxID=526729 RepID=A0A1T5KH59_9MICO|nr:histidine kinase [Krasilnikoviella flava]SKC62755.1 Signal transduction histidine kinase [Krasilnikoviella flava]
MTGRTTAGGGRRTLRWALGPLTSASTVRAGVYLVIGGVLAGAYVALAAGFVQMFADPATPRVAVGVLALVSAVIVGSPPFLAPVRALEIAAVRTFLDVDPRVLPDPVGPPTVATRWRGAAWFALHLALGCAVTLGLLVAVPLATQLALSAFGVDRSFLVQMAPTLVRHPAWWAALALFTVLALPYGAALARRLLRQSAEPLLGPDQTARIAELEAQADRLAERGRLAREVHDSVGHALTVTTLQAAAAARQVETDPAAARRSLVAIEEAGRSAMADLDHVLGLLRAGDDAPPGPGRAPARSLDDLPALVDDARHAGTDVRLDLRAETTGGAVPRATSHEAYRVVQEALTNAVRHAPGLPVTVRLSVVDGSLDVEVSNPLPGAPSPEGGGRGLHGMAERVRLLRGELEVGPRGGAWVVQVRFPLDRGAQRAG